MQILQIAWSCEIWKYFWYFKKTFLIFIFEKREKTSKYKGVYWHKKFRKWCARLCLKDGKVKWGGNFEDELDAGKRVNQLCEEFEIPLQNPEISSMPNQQFQVNKNCFLSDCENVTIVFFNFPQIYFFWTPKSMLCFQWNILIQQHLFLLLSKLNLFSMQFLHIIQMCAIWRHLEYIEKTVL